MAGIIATVGMCVAGGAMIFCMVHWAMDRSCPAKYTSACTDCPLVGPYCDDYMVYNVGSTEATERARDLYEARRELDREFPGLN
jgi:hypothetical protein